MGGRTGAYFRSFACDQLNWYKREGQNTSEGPFSRSWDGIFFLDFVALIDFLKTCERFFLGGTNLKKKPGPPPQEVVI